jgi:hypothetical protein
MLGIDSRSLGLKLSSGLSKLNDLASSSTSSGLSFLICEMEDDRNTDIIKFLQASKNKCMENPPLELQILLFIK